MIHQRKKNVSGFSLLGACFFLCALSGCSAQNFLSVIGLDSNQFPASVFPVKSPAENQQTQTPAIVVREGDSGGSAEKDEIPIKNFHLHLAHQGEITSIVVIPDGRKAFSAGSDGKIISSSIQGAGKKMSGRPLNRTRFVSGQNQIRVQTEVLFTSDKPVLALGLSPDERRLAVGQYSLVTIVDVSNRVVNHMLTLVKGRVIALQWDPTGKLLAVGRADGGVYIWNLGESSLSGTDNVRALEHYDGGTSAIAGLAFHPSGRAFIVAEQRGTVTMWRLLRAEKEMGLRDENAVIDHGIEGKTQNAFATLPTGLNDLWFPRDGSFLFAGGDDGNVYHWKVRGLIQFAPFSAGKGNILGIAGTQLKSREKQRGADLKIQPILLVTAQRGQKVKFWCSSDSGSFVQIAHAPVLTDPVKFVRFGSNSNILWVALKTGSIITFNASTLFDPSLGLSSAKLCR